VDLWKPFRYFHTSSSADATSVRANDAKPGAAGDNGDDATGTTKIAATSTGSTVTCWDVVDQEVVDAVRMGGSYGWRFGRRKKCAGSGGGSAKLTGPASGTRRRAAATVSFA